LATASAVVADVVDAVKHLNTNIISIWNPQELELADFSDSKSKFFVRCTDERADVEKIFENITYVVVAGIDETAFVTSEMTEKEFADAAAKIDLISRIRIED
ncbi:MAG: homoserine dehydrogenase, partial [Eubacterium sp.]